MTELQAIEINNLKSVNELQGILPLSLNQLMKLEKFVLQGATLINGKMVSFDGSRSSMKHIDLLNSLVSGLK